MTDCRIEFALLPTVCSLPVAFHPASRRRSYLQLSGAGLTQVRTFTQLFVCTRRRTSACRLDAHPCGTHPLLFTSQRKTHSYPPPHTRFAVARGRIETIRSTRTATFQKSRQSPTPVLPTVHAFHIDHVRRSFVVGLYHSNKHRFTGGPC